MKKSRKLNKPKKKAALGAQLDEYEQPKSTGISTSQIASKIPGPWGQLAQLGTGIGDQIRGDGTNAGAQVAANTFADPASRMTNAINSGDIRQAIPIYGDMLAAEYAQKAKKRANAAKEASITKGLMSFKKGGKMLAKQLNVVEGGHLSPVSDDAVEVKANNPNRVDSVELEDAFVDDNEIIDNKNRVFSDELGFAKAAKKLEKQKNKNPRFSKANQHIDRKLDELFEVQEQTKEGMKRGVKTKKVKGGYLELTGPFPMKPLKAIGGDLLAPIGEIDYNKPLNTKISQPASKYLPRKRTPGKFNVDKATATLATFGPNIASAIAQSKLKGPATPLLQKSIKLNRVRPDAQLAAADTAGAEASQIIKGNTAQAGDIASATGSIMAKKLSAKNQIYNDVNNINANIQHQEALANVGIEARNLATQNQVRQDTNDFSNLKQRLTTENVSNLASKYLQQRREKQQMKLDKEKESIRSLGYQDSNVYNRYKQNLKETDPEAFKDLYSHAKGGYLGGGETPNDPKKKQAQAPLSPSEFKPISWRSQGVADSTGLGTMYKTTYGALNKLNKTAIPTGVNPDEETYQQNPTGLTEFLANQKATQKLKTSPALNIAGEVSPEQGALAHFRFGGRKPREKGKDRRTIPQMTDPEILQHAEKEGLKKGGIHIKKSHRGLLHKNLGVKKGQKIPTSKLKVKATDSAAVKKRKVFAQNAKKWHHMLGGYYNDGGTIDKRHAQNSPAGDLNQFGGLGARKPYSKRIA